MKNSLITLWVVGINHGIMGEKHSKIGNANIDNFLRYDTEEFQSLKNV